MDFSIIIPAKNEEKNILRCLESINSMNFDKDLFEVLVIDNGSSDRTVEIAVAKGARVFEKPHLNISGLRNFGASQAKGAILTFLDADCTVAPTWLTEASRYLRDQSLSCFGGPPDIPSDATWVQKTWFQVRKKKHMVEDVEWLESMNMFVFRKPFNEVGGFNEKLVTCEDYDLSVRLKPFGRILSDHRIVAVHHGEASNLRHFFCKEYWRATSNFHGIKSHGFHWRELPSLVIPLLYCLLVFLALVFFPLGYLMAGKDLAAGFVGLLIIWQVPIALLAIWKASDYWDLRLASQLFVLLNVYFFARGLAVFRNK